MSASFAPKVKKTFTTDHVRPEKGRKTFTFELTVDKNSSSVELPGKKDKLTTTVVDKGLKTNEAAFEEIEFTKAGTYIFNITETASGKTQDDGYTYDTTTWKLTVPVKPEVAEGKDVLSVDTDHVKYEATKDGNTVVSEGKDSAATFSNTYTPAPTKYEPKVSKELSNGSAPVPSGEEKTFEFTLTQKNANPKDGATLQGGKPSVETTNKAGEKAAGFGDITFTKAGTYNFTITEKDTGEKGYGYDNSQWTLTVKVVDKGGKLEIDKDNTYYSKDGNKVNGAAAATFTNTYKPTETDYQLQVTKHIGGDDKDTAPEETFTFDLAFNMNLDGLKFDNTGTWFQCVWQMFRNSLL